MAAFAGNDTDSEDDLPSGWVEHIEDRSGRVQYVTTAPPLLSQYEHPRTGRRRRVPLELPYGWKKETDEEGRTVFRKDDQVSYTDPRLAFKIPDTSGMDDDVPFKQRFDGSSTANQVLHGKNLSALTICVTGANCGIGYETASSLAHHGAHVILACRDVTRGERACDKIRRDRPAARVSALPLNLASLTSVEMFSRIFRDKFDRLDVLILNAGTFGHSHELTEDGFELTFQANHLGHFYLVQLLEDVIIKSAPARIVVLASESHRFSFLTRENLCSERVSPPTSSGFMPMVAYNDSKLLNVAFAAHLDSRLSCKGVRAYAVHPGNMVNTSLSRNFWLYRFIFGLVRPFTKSLEQAAATVVFCAVADELKHLGGGYFNNCCPCKASKVARDPKFCADVWDLSGRMLSQRKFVPRRESLIPPDLGTNPAPVNPNRDLYLNPN